MYHPCLIEQYTAHNDSFCRVLLSVVSFDGISTHDTNTTTATPFVRGESLSTQRPAGQRARVWVAHLCFLAIEEGAVFPIVDSSADEPMRCANACIWSSSSAPTSANSAVAGLGPPIPMLDPLFCVLLLVHVVGGGFPRGCSVSWPLSEKHTKVLKLSKNRKW